MKIKVKKNQVYQSHKGNFTIIISGNKGGKWKAKVLTDKPNVYAGSHTFSETTLIKRFKLLE